MGLRWVALALLLLSGVARADDKAQARDHYQKGTKAFALGAYDEAVAEYSAAYRLVDDPALLYNIAQAHRLAGHASEALRFYRMYVTLLPRAPNRDEVDGKIAELTKLVDQQKRTQSALPPDAVRPPSEGTPPSTEKSPEPPPPVAEKPAELPSVAAPAPKKTKLIAGVVVGAVGVAALAAGIAMSVAAKSDSDDLSDSNTPYDPAKASAGATLGATGPALLAVGGAALVAGVVVVVIGAREARPRPTALRLVPVLSPTSVGAFAEMRF